MAVNIGDLNERIQVYVQSAYDDGMGGKSMSEELSTTTWAKVQEEAMTAAQGDGKLDYLRTYEITVRARINWALPYTGEAWVESCRRIVYRGRDLRVLGSVSLDKEYVQLTCTQKR